MKKLVLSLFLMGTMAVSWQVSAQDIRMPAPSPSVSIRQDFANSFIELEYSRPSVKGRKIFGDLVPFGKIWRTGANSATTIKFGQDVKVNGTEIKAGRYGLLTIPNEIEWVIILSKDTTVTSASAYKQENDVVRFSTRKIDLPMNMETFLIDINNITNNSCEVRLMWESTMVSFAVSADIDQIVMSDIEKAMKVDRRPYYQAARYYYENDKDMKQALEWINVAVSQRPDAYWVQLLKARIQFKLADYDGTIATAKVAAEKAKAGQNDEYVKMSEQLIKEAEGAKMLKGSNIKGKPGLKK